MTARELIQCLEQCPPNNTVYFNHADDILGEGYEIKNVIYIDVITKEKDTLTGVYLLEEKSFE